MFNEPSLKMKPCKGRHRLFNLQYTEWKCLPWPFWLQLTGMPYHLRNAISPSWIDKKVWDDTGGWLKCVWWDDQHHTFHHEAARRSLKKIGSLIKLRMIWLIPRGQKKTSWALRPYISTGHNFSIPLGRRQNEVYLSVCCEKPQRLHNWKRID